MKPSVAHRQDTIYLLARERLDDLLQYLRAEDYELLGPRNINGAISYDKIYSAADLPVGLKDIQSGGKYALVTGDSKSLFSYALGANSWKKYLFQQNEILYRATLSDKGLCFSEVIDDEKKRAFIGIRPCELAAIGVQDKVFIGNDYVDDNYAIRRKNIFTVAVNCTHAADTCFCSSLGTGPSVESGFDVALTEVVNTHTHFFSLQAGTAAGDQLIHSLQLPPANIGQMNAAAKARVGAKKQKRSLNTKTVKALLEKNITNESFWGQLAERCLSCGSCTNVCPTCFCSEVEDSTSLDGEHAQRTRHWDSCFNLSHSYLVGGSVRKSNKARYRQWLTHKLATWQDQFDAIGCVGCGRCITWCPVGIDLTEEITRLEKIEGETS